MTGYDFRIFWAAARCVLEGQSVYACEPGWFYPFPSIILFLPLGLLSMQVAGYLWTAASLTSLVIALKKRALWFMFFIPVLQVISQGQVDLILLPALASGSGIGMAFLMLKPQLAVLYLPFWFFKADGEQRKRFIVTSAILWGIPTLFYPTWIMDFLNLNSGKLASSAYASPSLWSGGVPLIIGIMVSVLLLTFSKDKYAATMAVNPAVRIYDLSMLAATAPWWIVPASWLVFYANGVFGNSWAGVILPLASSIYLLEFPNLKFIRQRLSLFYPQ